MKLSIKVTQVKKAKRACLVIGVFEQGGLTPAAKDIDKATRGFITTLVKQGTFQGKIGQTLSLFHLADTLFKHIVLVGCGSVQSLTPTNFQKLVFEMMKALKTTQTTHAICYLSELEVNVQQSLEWRVKEIAQGAIDGLYCFDRFKSQKERVSALKELIIHLPHAKQLKACKLALIQGIAVAHGVTLTKNLANLPSNICTPTFLAHEAKALKKQHRFISVKILNEKAMQKLGMGALLAVAKGSQEEAKFICIHYQGARKKQAPIVLIGKGVTFDTGGNSLKPADSMQGMKYDMCGAAAVFGIMKAVAELKLPMHLIGIIAAAENMPGGSAYKPEDIVTSLSGQTIEVLNTDAEGRLLLADALTYCERYQPDVVIDIATLTGACVIALGLHASALLSNDELLSNQLIKAGIASNDRAWQLPLWEEYDEQIKSSFADMANTGGRAAGVITAACFLARFAKKFKWAHLDVAGSAAVIFGNHERHATGRPVPMLVQYLINRVKSHEHDSG